MFTGIIEATGKIMDAVISGQIRTFWISSPISRDLRPDQSVAHDGVCLTIEEVREGMHRVSAIEETLKKTNISSWGKGREVNLERSVVMNGRIEGHLIQGHVDAMALCLERQAEGGTWEFRFEIPKKFSHLVIEKGSVALNGISLTSFDVRKKTFRVAIIPYTVAHTNIYSLQAGDSVNIEFDLIGKYFARFRELAR